MALLAKREETLLVPFAQVERHCWDWGHDMIDHALLLKGLNAWQRAIVQKEAEVRSSAVGGQNECNWNQHLYYIISVVYPNCL